MCRFAAYLGEPIIISELLHAPENSLINQSVHAREREEPLNGDGFGLGWYVPEISPEAAVFRSVQPAWNNANLSAISLKTRSGCLFAHVRAATQGEVSEANCHPFQFGSLLMMHNGNIGGFHRIVRQCRASLPDDVYHWLKGNTDSEIFFGLMLSKLPNRHSAVNITLAQMKKAFLEAVDVVLKLRRENEIVSPLTLNTVVSNGKWLFASKFATGDGARADTLYYSIGEKYACQDGECTMIADTSDSKSVLIVSEKLTENSDQWIPLSLNHCLLVTERGMTSSEKLEIGGGYQGLWR